jgi:hypothetical protein
MTNPIVLTKVELIRPKPADLRRRWGIMTPSEIDEQVREYAGADLVKGWIPERGITLIAGPSGIGKSPFLYQLSVAVAAGVSVLGRSVQSGKVLYLDGENGLAQISKLVTNLSTFSGLSAPPDDLAILSMDNLPPQWGDKYWQLEDAVRQVQPKLVVIDTFSSWFSNVEERNSTSAELYARLRRLIADTECSFVLAHHPRKPSSDDNKSESKQSLDNMGVREWFSQVRGASALVNGADSRLGMDAPGQSACRNSSVAIVVGGYARVRGVFPLTYLSRATDHEGEPIGYELVKGVDLLELPLQKLYSELPDSFTFKDAKLQYGHASQPTTNALEKLLSAGVIRKLEGRGYEKVRLVD